MVRHPEGEAYAGSRKWLQILVNKHPGLLDDYIVPRLRQQPLDVEWFSPLQSDDYAEYSDDDFIDRLGVALESRPLSKFWPQTNMGGGPHWDALGKTG